MLRPLIPETVEACAEPRGRLSFGFGARFFVYVLLGFLWLVPAWWIPQTIAGMLLWDLLALGAWLYDLRRLPRQGELRLRRRWTTAPLLARPCPVSIDIENAGKIPIAASMIDKTPASVRSSPPQLDAALFEHAAEPIQYEIIPTERGDLGYGDFHIRYRSSFGFAERWAVARLRQTVRVLPDLEEAKEHALYLVRSRQVDLQMRYRRQRGLGREFESLRDYRPGDDVRDICWPATARRHELTTRVFEAERSQSVWLVVDAGRLLRALVLNPGGVALSKLDYAVNAALSLAQVASQSGDKVGLLAYGRTIQQYALPARGARQIRMFVDALSLVHAESIEADHALAARTLLQKQSRRALIIWITDFAETPALPDVIESAMQMSHRHLVLFAAVSQPDLGALAEAVPQNEDEMFRHVAAVEIAQRRERLLRDLRQTGVLTTELPPGSLTLSLVNRYLEIKDRNLL